MNDYNKHPWVQSTRRQRRRVFFSLATLAPLMFAIGVYVLMRLYPTTGTNSTLIVSAIVLPLLFIAFIGTMIYFTSKRQEKFKLKLLACDGMLCPCCRRSLAQGLEDGKMWCEKCAKEVGRDEVRQFWGDFHRKPLEAVTWWHERHGDQPNQAIQKIARSIVPFIQPTPLKIVLSNAILWLGAGIAFSIISGNHVLIGAFTYLNMFLFMSGFMLISSGWKRRRGTSLHCAKCEYEQGPNQQSSKCPECGSDWNQIGGLIQGKIVPRRKQIAIGALFLVLAVATFYKPAIGTNWQLKLLPTSVLISEVLQKRGFTMSEWIELRTRSLSEDQKRILANGLIEKRNTKALMWLNADDDNWLVAEIAAGALPDDIKQRYYAEMLECTMVAPDRGKIAEPIKVSMQFTFRGASTNNPKVELYFGGFTIDDDPTPLQRQTMSHAGIMLDPKKSGGKGPKLALEVVPERAGPMSVRAKCWMVALPLGMWSQPIQWHENDEPLIPNGAVWQELREFEHRVVIVE